MPTACLCTCASRGEGDETNPKGDPELLQGKEKVGTSDDYSSKKSAPVLIAVNELSDLENCVSTL